MKDEYAQYRSIEQFSFGSIYWYKNPYNKKEDYKKEGVSHDFLVSRPVVCLTDSPNTRYPFNLTDITVCIMSTATQRVGIPFATSEGQYSVIVPYSVYNVSIEYLSNYLGQLPSPIVQELKEAVSYHLGLTQEVPYYLKNELTVEWFRNQMKESRWVSPMILPMISHIDHQVATNIVRGKKGGMMEPRLKQENRVGPLVLRDSGQANSLFNTIRITPPKEDDATIPEIPEDLPKEEPKKEFRPSSKTEEGVRLIGNPKEMYSRLTEGERWFLPQLPMVRIAEIFAISNPTASKFREKAQLHWGGDTHMVTYQKKAIDSIKKEGPVKDVLRSYQTVYLSTPNAELTDRYHIPASMVRERKEEILSRIRSQELAQRSPVDQYLLEKEEARPGLMVSLS